MIEFIQQLLEDGEIVVPRVVTSSQESVERLLIFSERIWRRDWPGTAPAFRVDVALRAVEVACLFAQATVYREIDEEQIAARLQSIGLKPEESPAAWYSADLTLRFIPQIYERLSRRSSDDPVLQLVADVGCAWPLSSVGIPGCGPNELSSTFSDRGIFQTYVDRVIASSDQERLELSSVANAVNVALGPFDNLRSKSGLALPIPKAN